MFKKNKLPYDFNALEPIISRETMDYHYNKHHQAYEDGLNNTIKKLQEEVINKLPVTDQHRVKYEKITSNLESLMLYYLKLPNEYHVGVRQFGGGLINHNFFFSILAKNKPLNDGHLKSAIEETFDSIDKWKEKMRDAALQVFGSGWTWLVIDHHHKLRIYNTFNQDNPWFLQFIPLIGIDVWEHAYYIDYRNDRKTYVTKFFDVINWEVVEKIYEDYLRTVPKKPQ